MTYAMLKYTPPGFRWTVTALLLPDEIASKSVIPAIRAMVVRRLVDEHGMTQQQAACLLGITQPAVSKYMHNKRGIAIRLDGIDRVNEAASKIAAMLVSGKAGQVQIMSQLNDVSLQVRKSRLMCDLHRRLEPSLNLGGCRICET
jgi:predicted transcriptional regulator